MNQLNESITIPSKTSFSLFSSISFSPFSFIQPKTQGDEEQAILRSYLCSSFFSSSSEMINFNDPTIINLSKTMNKLKATEIHRGVWRVCCQPEHNLCILKASQIVLHSCISCQEKKNWIIKASINTLEKDIITRISFEKPYLTVPTYCTSTYILMHEGIPFTCYMKLQNLKGDPQKEEWIQNKSFWLLGELHSMGIQHRDITLNNLIWYNDSIRFIDFGAARYLNFSPRISMTAQDDDVENFTFDKVIRDPCRCTYAYAAPEQLNDIRKKRKLASFPSLEPKKDVWSLGMSLFLFFARDNYLLYSYKESENEVKICTNQLLRIATRIELPTCLKYKNRYACIWKELKKASQHNSEANRHDRDWLKTHFIIKKALTWDICERPTIANLLNEIQLLTQKKTIFFFPPFQRMRKKKRKREEKKEQDVFSLDLNLTNLSLGKYPYLKNKKIYPITFADRFILIDWMFTIVLEYTWELEIWFVAVQTLDRFMLVTSLYIDLSNFKLIGGLCVLLACECSSDVSTSKLMNLLQDLEKNKNSSNPVEDILDYKAGILSDLKYQIWTKTSLIDLFKNEEEKQNHFKDAIINQIFSQCEKIALFNQKKEKITNCFRTIEDYFGKSFQTN